MTCFLGRSVVILYGNISDIALILYALVAQPVEHLTFNQRARDSSSLERTKIPRRIARFLVGFSFCTPFARFLHGFCTVRIFRVRWSKSVNYSAIRAIFCNSGQQSQSKLRFYSGVCVLQKLQQSRHGDSRFCFNRGSLHRCCSRLVEAFLELFMYDVLDNLVDKVNLSAVEVCAIKILRKCSFRRSHIKANDFPHEFSQRFCSTLGFISVALKQQTGSASACCRAKPWVKR